MARPSLRSALIAVLAFLLAACRAQGDPSYESQPLPAVASTRNTLSITPDNRITWNGHSVTDAQLALLLKQSRALPTEPELQFMPDAGASYDVSARVLQIIKESGATKFGFVGNEAFVTPGEQPAR